MRLNWEGGDHCTPSKPHSNSIKTINSTNTILPSIPVSVHSAHLPQSSQFLSLQAPPPLIHPLSPCPPVVPARAPFKGSSDGPLLVPVVSPNDFNLELDNWSDNIIPSNAGDVVAEGMFQLSNNIVSHVSSRSDPFCTPSGLDYIV